MINLNRIYWSKTPAKVVSKVCLCLVLMVVLPVYIVGVLVSLVITPDYKRFKDE